MDEMLTYNLPFVGVSRPCGGIKYNYYAQELYRDVLNAEVSKYLKCGTQYYKT